MLTLEVLPPLPGLGDFYAAHLVATRLAVKLELRVAPDAVFSQVGHGLGRVGLEHEPRGVGGGPARLEERTLIQDHHIPPSEPAQMLGDTAADDPGPNDHNPRTTLHTPPRAAKTGPAARDPRSLRPTPWKTPPRDGTGTGQFEVCCA